MTKRAKRLALIKASSLRRVCVSRHVDCSALNLAIAHLKFGEETDDDMRIINEAVTVYDEYKR